MKLPALCLLFSLSPLSAATWTVTSTANAGAGTLREALAAAADGDTITFGGPAFVLPAGPPGSPPNRVTIRLSSPLTVDKAVTIEGLGDGQGGNVVVLSGDADSSGGPSSGDCRALVISAPTSTGTLTVRRITFQRCASANEAGAVLVDLTHAVATVFDRCDFLSNHAGTSVGALSSSAAIPLELNRCVFASNTAESGIGAVRIREATALLVKSCRFSGNQALDIGKSVGAMEVRDMTSALIEDCEFEDNTVLEEAGALRLASCGATLRGCTFSGNSAKNAGALSISSTEVSPVLVENCTFSGNEASSSPALLIKFASNVTLRHLTITGNTSISPGAGAVAFGSNSATTVGSCIIAANPTASSSNDLVIASGATVNSGGGNIIGNADGAGRPFSGPGDLDGTALSPVDPGLLPLADNGGETRTHALQPLSVAVDHAGSSTLTLDQRGEARPSGSARDAGAFERQLISFADWAADRLAAYPVSERQANDDPDGDGLSNGIEFIQGTAPAVSGQQTDRMEIDAGGTWYSFTVSNEADLGTLTAEIEESDNLNFWQTRSITNKDIGAVFDSTIAARTRYRLPISTAGRTKCFVRLNVRPLQPNN